jgi:hypothetical protein
MPSAIPLEGFSKRRFANAIALLKQAAALYDDPQRPFATQAQQAWKGGFISGAAWMELVLAELRGQRQRPVPACLQGFGILKYTLATLAASMVLWLAVTTQRYPLLLLCIPAFYAVEVQMVFLFPIVLDRLPKPFKASLQWTKAAGGTLATMRIVLVLAAVMLFGGLFGKGFIRCWCLGCLAVVLWYEDIRQARNQLARLSSPAYRAD